MRPGVNWVRFLRITHYISTIINKDVTNRSCTAAAEIGQDLQVLVRDNNIDQALRVLKKKMQREGVFREMKARKAYEKPSERRAREQAEAVRRSRKAARKQAIREGLIAAPKKKEIPGRGRAAGAPSAAAPSAARE